MVKPSQRKAVALYLKKSNKVGWRLICQLLSISKSYVYYKSKKDDSKIISVLMKKVRELPTRGFDEYNFRLRREGFNWNRKRVLRVYREMGLVRRKKPRKQLPEGLRQPLFKTKELNEVWSMDFMTDSLIDGRKFRSLNVIDDYNRECLLGKGSLTYPSTRVTDELDYLIAEHGKPEAIRTDNGPEFISGHYREWCKKQGIQILYSNPGKPMENGYVERFNRTFREEVMDAYLFSSIIQFNIIADKKIKDYNSNHPHRSLDRKTPLEFAQRQQPYT